MSKLKDAGIGLVIIGQATPIKKATMPEKIWVDEIVFACDKARIRVFEKNNLMPILGKNLRQEFPERRD